MWLTTQRDVDLFSYFDVIDENEIAINHSSLKQIFIRNHSEANRGLIRGHLPLEFMFVFCK